MKESAMTEPVAGRLLTRDENAPRYRCAECSHDFTWEVPPTNCPECGGRLAIMTEPVDDAQGVQLMAPDLVLQQARDLHRFYLSDRSKPYTAGVLADCIATIETLQTRAAPVPQCDAGSTRLRQLFSDHYWDSFEADKEIILKHIDFVLGLASPPSEAGREELIASALYAKWSHEADEEPDWEAYRNNKPLNPVGLSKLHFMEEAKTLLEALSHPDHGTSIGSPNHRGPA